VVITGPSTLRDAVAAVVDGDVVTLGVAGVVVPSDRPDPCTGTDGRPLVSVVSELGPADVDVSDVGLEPAPAATGTPPGLVWKPATSASPPTVTAMTGMARRMDPLPFGQ